MFIEQPFLAANRTYFNARVDSLDFTSPAAAPTINTWVDQQTHGLIHEIVPDPLRYERGHSALVVEELRKRLGSVVEIVVEEVRSIPRSKRGKMQPVVNLCKDLLPPSLRYSDSEEDLIQNL